MTTTLKQEPIGDTSQTMQSQAFDIDQYLNLDHAGNPSLSVSPANNSKAFAIPSPSPLPTPSLLQQLPQQQTFSGPSHQYEQYKQQTGLPVGALASTFALNDPDHFNNNSNYSSYPFDSSSDDALFGMNSVEPDLVDFNTLPQQTPSADIEMDYGSMNRTDFVNPAAVSGPLTISYTQTSQANRQGRVWPGMHQQAAMAKAQQQAALAAQRQRSASLQSSQQNSGQEKESEEVVEESITRLLNRMRNSSVASSGGDDSHHAGGSGSRMRKDEEDMDEDERLLASEEGKKLSSKERRQLRNKVSARAFRSRRKEYIGQLEGEIAAKTSEADELRTKNSELMAENGRLTDLTRMLLSSPAFSEFLNDLSGTGPHAAALQGLTQPSTQSQQPQESVPPRDANPNQYNVTRGQGAQNTTHIGMTMIPEEPVLEAEPSQNRYTSNNNSGLGLYDAQVYAMPTISEVPPIYSVDFTLLNDKTAPDSFTSMECKTEPSEIQPLPAGLEVKQQFPAPVSTPQEEKEDEDEEDDVSDFKQASETYDSDSFDLFADDNSSNTSASAVSIASADQADEDSIFGSIPTPKALQRLDLIIAGSGADAEVDEKEAAIARFERRCWVLDQLSDRIDRITKRRC